MSELYMYVCRMVSLFINTETEAVEEKMSQLSIATKVSTTNNVH